MLTTEAKIDLTTELKKGSDLQAEFAQAQKILEEERIRLERIGRIQGHLAKMPQYDQAFPIILAAIGEGWPVAQLKQELTIKFNFQWVE